MATRKDASRSVTARKRLGRGLDSLISTVVGIDPSSEEPMPPPTTAPHQKDPGDGRVEVGDVRMVAADRIHPSPSQPRQDFDAEALDALAASIKSAGVMQPIVVRPEPPDFPGQEPTYRLIVGERRWRAAQRIGLTHLPSVVRRIDDKTAAEWALIENIQREDLNPIERADAFRQLTEEHGLTHQELADRVGLKRSTVTNFLRLHELDDLTKDAVRHGRLTQGQARALLAITNLDTRQRLAGLAIRQRWSVRTLEQRAAALTSRPRGRPREAPRARSPHMEDLERRLGEHLGTRVSIQPGKTKGSGRLVLEFYTLEQFDGLMERLGFAATSL
ncbi:MAG: ParB/RepB/Spo0J family partition protein [Planctomycetota bacterium]|jgi:ParB family chromosome partitioning protein